MNVQGRPRARLVLRGLVVAVVLACHGALANEIEVTLTEGTNFAAALSPADGSFVIDLQGTLWSLPAEGGVAEPLTGGLGDERLPAFAPDGSRLVFQSYARGTWDIFMLDADGTDLIALTEGAADDREPVLSPDGNRVLFSSDRTGNYDVWLLDIGTRELTQITTHEANDYMPSWAPRGNEMAFVSERGAEGSMGLYRLSLADGESPEPIRIFPHRIASPSWSPDGRRIAVRVLETGTASADAAGRAAEASRLTLVPVSGGESEIVPTPPDVFPFRAQWSGANEISYTATGSLWRQSLTAGSEAERVPFEARVSLNRPAYRRRPVEFPEGRERLEVRGFVRPVVSPDGTRLAFAALGDIWVVPLEGGAPVAVTRDEYLDSDPHWGPDSRSVVFASDRSGTMDLWIKNVDLPRRTGERRLTTALGAEVAPAWSPDGAKIAYLDERSRLHVVDAEGGESRVLTPERRGVSLPTWSSDSQHLAMTVHVPVSTRFREGHNRIAVVDVRSGEERILDEPAGSFGSRDGDGPVWSPDGRSLAFALDGGLWLLPVEPDGGPTDRPRQVGGEAVAFPSWIPGGDALVYVAPSGLRRLDLSSGNVSDIDVEVEYEVMSARGELLIRDVRVVDGTGRPAQNHRDVLIRGNRIESIEATGLEPAEGVRVLNGAGKTLIPGLIEMHTHLSLPQWGSRHGRVWLAHGVTAMRSLVDAPYRVLEERESIRSGRRVGPRVYFTGGSIDGGRIYYTASLAVDDEEELEQELERAFALGYDLVKTYVRLPDDLQRRVVERAHAEGVFVSSHEVYPAVAYGVDGIEHVRGTSRRGFSPKISEMRRSYDDVVELIARSGVYFTPTVLIHGGWSLALAREPNLLEDRRFRGLFPAWVQDRVLASPRGSDRERAKNVIEPVWSTVGEIAARGGKVLAGTDSDIVPYGLSLLIEIEQLSEAGLGPMAALQSATKVAAEALGAAEDLGTIEPGKIADLVLLDGDPLEDIKNLRKTSMVVVNGRLVSVEQLLRNP